MTIQFQIRGMDDSDEVRRQVETDLQSFSGLIEVTAAYIALHCQGEATPPYQVMATLDVPGPKVHAAARDHTWLAAWQKAVTRLREQIGERRSRPAIRKSLRG